MKKKLPLPEAPREICILRLSALGDATHTVPVIRSIQAHWPDTKISWIIGKLEHRLLKDLQGINFIPFNKRGGLAAVMALKRQLEGKKFDVLMHMQVALRANIISRLIDAPIRLGWDRGRSRDRHHWFTNHSVRSVPFQHQVPGFLEFPRALGVPITDPKWDLPVNDSDREWAAQQLPDDRPVLMISPCSSHELRNWRNEYYAMVADHAAIDLGMQVVLIGGPSDLEQSVGFEIESAMSSKAVNLIGEDTLGQSMALMEKATVLLAPDAGPIHIASALGTRVLGLYAATWSKRRGPFNSLDYCIDRYAQAARKYRRKEPEQVRWGHRIETPGVMDLVEPQSVIEMLEKIMMEHTHEQIS
jgi:heptosyltransferase I